MRYWLLPICVLLLAGRLAVAQDGVAVDAHFATENPSPLVGEPVELTLYAALPPAASLISWPDFPSSWGTSEITDVGDLEIAESPGGFNEYRQTLTIWLWEPGSFETPETRIIYQQAGVEPAELSVPPLHFEVPSVLDGADLSLKPMQAQIDVPYTPPALIIGVLGVVTSVIIWWVDRWHFRRTRQKPAGVINLDRAALASLGKINPQTTEPEAAYAEAADCLRDYVARQFNIAANELTTFEIVSSIQPYLSRPHLNRLYQLMTQADLVKFARQVPDRPAAARYLEAASQWVRAAASEVSRMSPSGDEV